MRLHDFIKLAGLKQNALAKALGWHTTKVCLIVNGKKLPSLKEALELERFTKGAVTPRDFVDPHQ